MNEPYAIITKDITQAAKYIHEGRVVAFPTGTCYGLAANALDGYALQRLRNIKNRPEEKTFTVFMTNKLQAKYLDLTDPEKALLAKMADQPLTLLVKPASPLQYLAANNLIGLRVIDHPLMQKLAEVTKLPLTATSANRSGEPPCSSPTRVTKAFPGLLPDSYLDEEDPQGASGTTYDLSLAAVIDGGKLPPSQPTTIAQLDNNIKIIRAGALSQKELQSAL